MPLSLIELMQRATQIARRQRPMPPPADKDEAFFWHSDLGAIGPLAGTLADEDEVAAAPAQATRGHASSHPMPSGDVPTRFEHAHFEHDGTAYNYRLFEPLLTNAAPRALLVLLHGCTQDAADFATGTAMNELAAQHGCIVLYPEQNKSANQGRCWNWFQPEHQQRDQGEPGMIAALTRHVLQDCEADPQRVYIAGLSAGGAMALTVAHLYPELFTALGVHSGLPRGVAEDMGSAFSVMRRGPSASSQAQASEVVMPSIVIHGAADRTVHPGNGEQIVQHALNALAASGRPLAALTSLEAASARTATRTRYLDSDGRSWVEHWQIEAGPHAWSGGSTKGSFTDPNGPSASAAMLDFFLQHQRS